MLSNWPIVILAFSVLAVGLIGVVTTAHKPYSIGHTFCLIVMVSGAMMTAGIVVFALLSAFMYAFGAR